MSTGERSLNEGLRAALYRFYFGAEKLITPTLRSSQYAYYDALRAQLTPTSRWLDMGCGHRVFGEWMADEQDSVIRRCATVAGIDLDWEGLLRHTGIRKRVSGDLTSLPFQSGTWDVVTANMVMEHVAEPAAVLREVHRVLTPGGVFLFHTPNLHHWGTMVARALPDRLKRRLIRLLEGRVEADVFTTHYRINTADAVRRFAQASGFEVVQLSQVSSSATLAMLGPPVLLELAFIRLIQRPQFAGLRSALVVTLRKRR